MQLRPHFAETENNLGVVLAESGQLEEAIAAYRRALQIQPNLPAAHNNLGRALATAGRFEDAIVAHRRALELAPDFHDAFYRLGIALSGQGAVEEAICAYRQALDLKSDSPAVHHALGTALARLGRYPEAIAAYQQALQLMPDLAETWCNLGISLAAEEELEGAINAFRRALDLRPDFVEALNNLGNGLRDKGELDEAISTYRQVLRLQPELVETLNNLGNTLRDQGRLDEAIAAYHEALKMVPTNSLIHSNLIFALNLHPSQDFQAIVDAQQEWDRQISKPARAIGRAYDNVRDPERPLRIGYVSVDFREHVVGRNILPLFRHHDRQSFEIFCYSGVEKSDGVTEEFRERAAHWRSTVGVSDAALAEMIQRDGIDILIDLGLHTAGNRLAVFPWKPAPVQVSFAGYPESTGLKAIEFRISDRFLESDGSENGLRRDSREHVHLIDSFWCYDPCDVAMDIDALPAETCRRVTFGCLNSYYKINEPLLKLWAQVITKVDGSRLVMLGGARSWRERMTEFLEAHGVATDRLEFVTRLPRQEYFEVYRRLDIVLDPFPYNGHTTSLDAFWMGVPVVSLIGRTRVSRGGWSILNNIGLPELAAPTPEDFVRIASGPCRRFAAVGRTSTNLALADGGVRPHGCTALCA